MHNFNPAIMSTAALNDSLLAFKSRLAHFTSFSSKLTLANKAEQQELQNKINLITTELQLRTTNGSK